MKKYELWWGDWNVDDMDPECVSLIVIQRNINSFIILQKPDPVSEQSWELELWN